MAVWFRACIWGLVDLRKEPDFWPINYAKLQHCKIIFSNYSGHSSVKGKIQLA